MKPTHTLHFAVVVTCMFLVGTAEAAMDVRCNARNSCIMKNDKLYAAVSGPSGLTYLNVKGLLQAVGISHDCFRITTDTLQLNCTNTHFENCTRRDANAALANATSAIFLADRFLPSGSFASVSCFYSSQSLVVEVVYGLGRDWQFLTKQLVLHSVKTAAVLYINETSPWQQTALSVALKEHTVSEGFMGPQAMFLRLLEPPGGVFFSAQSALLTIEATCGASPEHSSMVNHRLHTSSKIAVHHVGGKKAKSTEGCNQPTVTITLPSKVIHNFSAEGSWVGEAGLLGAYELVGAAATRPVNAAHSRSMWQNLYGDHGSKRPLDVAERDAYLDCVDAFSIPRPHGRAPRVHIPWTENDYQIDLARPGDWEQYERVFARLKSFKVTHMLAAASDTSISNRSMCSDDWCWEANLWLGLGPHIRTGSWLPGRDPLPPTTQKLLQTAKMAQVKLMAYVYPSLDWTALPTNQGIARWNDENGNVKATAQMDNTRFQEYFVGLILKFAEVTGIAGVGFDYTWLNNAQASTLAQWRGWRRILLRLREARPDFVIDSRQANHQWGPWMWVAGGYAEPLLTDEQPETWSPYKVALDLSTDRLSANYLRCVNWRYQQRHLAPITSISGFIGHQTDRYTAEGFNPYKRLNVRDFDLLGFKYSVITSVGVGSRNHVVNMVPARDLQEYRRLPQEYVDWVTHWLQWGDMHSDYLERTRPLPQPPVPGHVDGTYAIKNNNGFLFLFNPNAGAMAYSDPVILDGSLGFTAPPDTVNLNISSAAASTTTGGVMAFVNKLKKNKHAALKPHAQRRNLFGNMQKKVMVDLDSDQDGGDESSRGAAAHGSHHCSFWLMRSVFPASMTLAALPWKAALPQVMLPGRSANIFQFTCVPPSALPLTRPVVVGLPHTTLTFDNGVVDVVGAHGEEGRLYTGVKLWGLSEQQAKSVQKVRINGVEWQMGAAIVDVNARGEDVWEIGISEVQMPGMLQEIQIASPPDAPATGRRLRQHNNAQQPTEPLVALRGSMFITPSSLQQLSARAAAFSVPWTSEDLQVPWLSPGRPLVFIEPDMARVAPSRPITLRLCGCNISALGCLDVPAGPGFNARSLRREDTFMGFWVDLSRVGVVAACRYDVMVLQTDTAPGSASGLLGAYLANVEPTYLGLPDSTGSQRVLL